MTQRPSRISRSSGNISFNNPSAPGIHNFRIGLSESTEQQQNPLRAAFLENQISCLALQHYSVIQELHSRLSSLTQENDNLRSEVAALKDQMKIKEEHMKIQEVALSISNKEFFEYFFPDGQFSVNGNGQS
ncbi:1821_t:CDS:1 [Dentiscutata erythropus]|uniref:1821_t:CDS:1 n=1 Tax=Dentiscutata erythropus TaxID=1348616 RepID=A0A9N9PC74_9GLOM|nr:1821_t:CDS:1 [Dentiscutata erythropus]